LSRPKDIKEGRDNHPCLLPKTLTEPLDGTPASRQALGDGFKIGVPQKSPVFHPNDTFREGKLLGNPYGDIAILHLEISALRRRLPALDESGCPCASTRAESSYYDKALFPVLLEFLAGLVGNLQFQFLHIQPPKGMVFILH